MINIKRLWKYEIKGEVNRVGSCQNGHYVVAVSADDKRAYLLSGSGELKWSFEAKAGFNSIAVSPNGNSIIIGTKDGVLTELDRNKNVIWKESVGVNSIAFSADNRLFVCGGNDGNVYCFTKYVRLLWRWAIGDYINCLALASEEHSVVVSSENKNIYLLTNNGRLQWQNRMRSGIKRVAISSDGYFIVAGGGDEYVYSLDKKSTLNWKCETGEMINAVSITPNGDCIVAGSEYGSLFVINKRGEIVSICSHNEPIHDLFILPSGGLVVGSRGNIAFYKVDVEAMLEPVSNMELLIKEIAKMNQNLSTRYEHGAVVMFTQIKDYSPWTGEETLERKVRLSKYEELVNSAIIEYEGIKIKSVQDASFIVFIDPLKAISYSLKLKEIFKEYNQDKPDKEMIPIQIGMNFIQTRDIPTKGLPIEVTIASEITPLSVNGKILLTKSLINQVEGKMMLDFNSIGGQRLKSLEKPLPVYEVEESPFAKTGWF